MSTTPTTISNKYVDQYLKLAIDMNPNMNHDTVQKALSYTITNQLRDEEGREIPLTALQDQIKARYAELFPTSATPAPVAANKLHHPTPPIIPSTTTPPATKEAAPIDMPVQGPGNFIMDYFQTQDEAGNPIEDGTAYGLLLSKNLDKHGINVSNINGYAVDPGESQDNPNLTITIQVEVDSSGNLINHQVVSGSEYIDEKCWAAPFQETLAGLPAEELPIGTHYLQLSLAPVNPAPVPAI